MLWRASLYGRSWVPARGRFWRAGLWASASRSVLTAARQVSAVHCGARGHHQAGALPADLLYGRVRGGRAGAAGAAQVPPQVRAAAGRAGAGKLCKLPCMPSRVLALSSAAATPDTICRPAHLQRLVGVLITRSGPKQSWTAQQRWAAARQSGLGAAWPQPRAQTVCHAQVLQPWLGPRVHGLPLPAHAGAGAAQAERPCHSLHAWTYSPASA